MELIKRPYWENLIENAWTDRTVVWLMGLRRVGKTSLCLSLPDVEYLDCERPLTRQLMADPENFLESKRGKRIALDEIHRLDNPSELLKLAADHYKDVKIIATGSSTLGASRKFKDTLTGRKHEIWLTPLLLSEMQLFGKFDIWHRFLFGGFPSYFVKDKLIDVPYQEWFDAYWAKDIEEVFSVGKRSSFLKFAELLLVQSGGQFEASRFATRSEVSRVTIAHYLDILETTFVVHIIRPYSSNKATEIVKAPKIYGCDTGFVCYAKGKGELGAEDIGLMWEHCVLNELHGFLRKRAVNYWRDKQGRELDFVIKDRGNNKLTAIECKFSVLEEVTAQTIRNFEAFRQLYPHGENFIVSYNLEIPFTRNYKDLTINFVSPQQLVKKLEESNLRF